MKYHLFFPNPTKHEGLFKQRSIIIENYNEEYSDNNNFHFQDQLPSTLELHKYFQLIKKNPFSNEYLGSLLTDDNSWKLLSAAYDLKNLHDGMETILEKNVKHAYFMTNSAGHHADNIRYELFCPINQLFFIVEYLNYHANFPNIFWLDIDAHYGNGDKAIFDKYKQKMRSEFNNLSGISIHNDSSSFREDEYEALNYDNKIAEQDFIDMLKNTQINNDPIYILLFFGTDIFKGDYGGNKNLSNKIIPEILTIFESQTEKNKKLIIFQTGGSNYENIDELIDQISKR